MGDLSSRRDGYSYQILDSGKPFSHGLASSRDKDPNTTSEQAPQRISLNTALQHINDLLPVPRFLTDWKDIQNHLIAGRTRNLFDAEIYDLSFRSQDDSSDPALDIKLNNQCMTSLRLLDGTPILTLFDTGSTVNLISEQLVKDSPYLSQLPILHCPGMTVNNTTGSRKHDRFLELCFKLPDHQVLFTTALIIPDFGTVKFLLSKNSMSCLEGLMDLRTDTIRFHKKEFALRSNNKIYLKPNSSRTITVRSKLPSSIKNSDLLCRTFMPYSKYLPRLFKLKFKRGYSVINVSNPTNSLVIIPSNAVIGSVSLDLCDRFDSNVVLASHSHTDTHGDTILCSHDWATCPLRDPTSPPLDFKSLQSHPYTLPTSQLPHAFANLSSDPHPSMSMAEKMDRYRSFDQSKMTASEIRSLKKFTFPYLDDDDVRLSLPDSEIITRELDLTTDSVLTPSQRIMANSLFYELRDCLSIHDNPSISSKRFVKLNPVNLPPFYIKPYLTHPEEIKFAEKELRKLQLMGILQRGSSEFLSPIMLIRKSHSGQVLSKSAPWRAVANFQYLNKHLPDVKFSYPDVKHVLHKIGRSKAGIFSVLDLKHAFYSINLDPDSIQYTTVCGSPGSPSYQYLRLPQGLKLSPAYFTNLMNDIMSEMDPEDREYLECIMDDCIVFTPDMETHCRVLRHFLLKLKEYGLLLTVNKIHAFRSSVKYMGLKLSRSSEGPVIQPLGSRIQSAQTLPIPTTARGIKSFIGCVIYLSQFLPKLSELVKPINDILKEANAKKKELDKISPLKEYQKGKGRGKNRSLNIQSFWTNLHTENFNKIKDLIVKSPVLHLPNSSGHFTLECDSSCRHVGAALFQDQGGSRVIVAYFSAVMPEPAKRYSATEIELCGLKKAIIHFQYLLKYSKFSVIMDHSALRRILGSKKQARTNRIQKYVEELSDFNFEIKHNAGKHMFISDFLSRFSAPNTDEEPIPYLTSTKDLSVNQYMALLDRICQYDPVTGSGLCTRHDHMQLRSDTKRLGITLPSLFDRDPPTRRSRRTAAQKIAPPPVAPAPREQQPVRPAGRRRGRPPKKSSGEIVPALKQATTTHNNKTGSTTPPVDKTDIARTDISRDHRYDLRSRSGHEQKGPSANTHPAPSTLPDQLPDFIPEPEDDFLMEQIETTPLSAPVPARARPRSSIRPHPRYPSEDKGVETLNKSVQQPLQEDIALPDFLTPPAVQETIIAPDPPRHFPKLTNLFPGKVRDVTIKTRRDVPTQAHIDKIVQLLEAKTSHEYRLPFSLQALKQAQRKDSFFAPFIKYLESDHLPSNSTARKNILSESDYYALFGGVLFRMVPQRSRDISHKLTLCIPLDLAHKLFEIYHSGLLASHQGITRTFYKIRQDFYVRNLYKHLYLYIMSCRICSARRNIPPNEKHRAWADTSIVDFSIFESLSMDIKVMPASTDGKHYLLVLRCNHSRFIITDALYTRKAVEVAESFFQNVICAHGTNIKKVYCDLDTAFKNAVMDYLTKTFGIEVMFCSVESHQSNPAERSIKSVGDLLIHYMATFGNKWSSIHRLAAFAVNTFPISHLSNLSSYEMVYGRAPPVLTQLTAEADRLCKPVHYDFTDYMDFLRDRINHIRTIALKNHNAMVEKSRTAHGRSQVSLREFHVGDIVYCHFPSKTTLGPKEVSSRKFQLTYVGPLYIHGRYDKFLYTLATLEGVVIDQLFHVSRLKKGFLRLGPKSIVRNIHDYQQARENANKTLQAVTQVTASASVSPSTPDKSADRHSHGLWCTDPSCIFVYEIVPTLSTEQQQSHGTYSHNLTSDTFPEFYPDDNIDMKAYYTITKARYKYGVLQLYTTLYSKGLKPVGLWQSIPPSVETSYHSFFSGHMTITGSKPKFMTYLFQNVARLY